MPGMGRRAPRRDDVRLAHAHVTRMLANNLLPGSLADNVVSAGKEFAALEPVAIGFQWDCLMACTLRGVPCLATMQMVRNKLSEDVVESYCWVATC